MGGGTSTVPSSIDIESQSQAKTAAIADNKSESAENNITSVRSLTRTPEPNNPIPDTSQAQFNEQSNYVARRRIITIFLACASIDMVSLLDQTSMTVALPIIATRLGAGSQSIWFANGYFVTSTACQLLYGRFSDIISRKVVVLIGLPIFFFASLGASLAQTSIQLIVFRAFAGIGGGGLLSLAQIIVSDVVSLRDRGKYQGILGSVAGLSNGIGPVIGGAFASSSPNGWRWIFRLNLFLITLAFIAVLFFMPLRKVEGSKMAKLKAIDFSGAGIVFASTTLLVIALTWAGGQYRWNSAQVLATLLCGVVGFVVFVLWEYKIPRYPVMPLHIFKSRIVIGATLTTFFNGWLFFTQVFYIPQYYQIVAGYSPILAGVLIIPLTVTHTASSTIAGLILTKTGRYKELVLIGWMLWAVSSGLWSICNSTSNIGEYVGFSLLMGLGVGQTLQPTLVAIQAGVARKDMAAVTALRNFSRNLGGALGLAAATTIINNTVRSAINGKTIELSSSQKSNILTDPTAAVISDKLPIHVLNALARGYRQGFHYLFIVNAALATFACFIVVFLFPLHSVDRADDEKLRKEAAQRLLEEKEKRSGREALSMDDRRRAT